MLRAASQPSLCPLRSTQTPSERLLWDVSLRIPSCLEAFQDPQFQGLFRHLLRTKANGSTERWDSMPETNWAVYSHPQPEETAIVSITTALGSAH